MIERIVLREEDEETLDNSPLNVLDSQEPTQQYIERAARIYEYREMLRKIDINEISVLRKQKTPLSQIFCALDACAPTPPDASELKRLALAREPAKKGKAVQKGECTQTLSVSWKEVKSEAQIPEEAEFECLRKMLCELAAECSLTLEEVENLFANVSCRMDALVDVLCGEKSNALVWNALEDMALKHEPEAQEY